jgi:hypothetical protein
MKMSAHLHTLAVLPLRKSPRYPLNMRLDGPQSRSGLYEREKNIAKKSKIINIRQKIIKIRKNIYDNNVVRTLTT